LVFKAHCGETSVGIIAGMLLAVTPELRDLVARVQKYRADTALVIVRAAPNSLVYQRVESVLRIRLSKTPGTTTL